MPREPIQLHNTRDLKRNISISLANPPRVTRHSLSRHKPIPLPTNKLRILSGRREQTLIPDLQDITKKEQVIKGLLLSYYNDDWFDTTLTCAKIIDFAGKYDRFYDYCFQDLYGFISDLLLCIPNPQFLMPDIYKNDFSEQLPCRDTVVYQSNVYCIGQNLLDAQSPEKGKSIRMLLWEKIHHGRTNEILGLENYKENIEILDVAWKISSYCCHNLRRYDDLSFNRWLANLKESQDILGASLGETIALDLNNLANENDHGPKLAARLFTDYGKIAQKKSSITWPEKVACLLAILAICKHNYLLEKIDDKNNSPRRLEKEEIWEDFPLAAFLATTILLAEMTLRPCWYDNNERDMKSQDWKTLDINCIVPISELNLNWQDGIPILNFKLDSKCSAFRNKLLMEADIPPPICESKQEALRKAFGPNGMGLLSEEEATSLDFLWDGILRKPSNGLLKHEERENKSEELQNKKERLNLSIGKNLLDINKLINNLDSKMRSNANTPGIDQTKIKEFKIKLKKLESKQEARKSNRDEFKNRQDTINQNESFDTKDIIDLEELDEETQKYSRSLNTEIGKDKEKLISIRI